MFARLTLFLLRSGTLYDRYTYLSMESQDLHKSFSSTLTPVGSYTHTLSLTLCRIVLVTASGEVVV